MAGCAGVVASAHAEQPATTLAAGKVVGGRLRVGLERAELETLAEPDRRFLKLSSRDRRNRSNPCAALVLLLGLGLTT